MTEARDLCTHPFAVVAEKAVLHLKLAHDRDLLEVVERSASEGERHSIDPVRLADELDRKRSADVVEADSEGAAGEPGEKLVGMHDSDWEGMQQHQAFRLAAGGAKIRSTVRIDSRIAEMVAKGVGAVEGCPEFALRLLGEHDRGISESALHRADPCKDKTHQRSRTVKSNSSLPMRQLGHFLPSRTCHWNAICPPPDRSAPADRARAVIVQILQTAT